MICKYAVPYGLGAGDFVAVGTIAWAGQKSSNEAPKSFKNIQVDVLSLHALTKEVEETVFKAPLAPEREARLSGRRWVHNCAPRFG